MKIINTTPHPVRFQNAAGEVFEVDPCGTLINARPVEETAGTHPSGAALVRTRFEADPSSEEALARLEQENPGAIIVGSIVAAQAFPGRVFAMVPAPGFERVPPAEKRMRDDKFTTFEDTKKETKARPCTCGSGQPWTICQGGPWGTQDCG